MARRTRSMAVHRRRHHARARPAVSRRTTALRDARPGGRRPCGPCRRVRCARHRAGADRSPSHPRLPRAESSAAAVRSGPSAEPYRLITHAGGVPTGAQAAAARMGRRGRGWEFYGSTEGQFTVCSAPTGSSAQGRWVGARRTPPRSSRRRDLVSHPPSSRVSAIGTTMPRRLQRGDGDAFSVVTLDASTTASCTWRADARTSSSVVV